MERLSSDQFDGLLCLPQFDGLTLPYFLIVTKIMSDIGVKNLGAEVGQTLI